MSLFVLDTDILSLYQEGNATVANRVFQHSSEELAVTIISVEEQLRGWFTLRRRAKSRKQVAYAYERFTRSVASLSTMSILAFTEAAIDRYEQLRKLKLGVKANDLRIAAIAIDKSAIVVTRNRVDFGRVPDLQIENWME
jgi:tRNA(fMet)-specific endonuclease VapC